jgi:vacuolar-type H+-ATPase subunit I/STV1
MSTRRVRSSPPGLALSAKEDEESEKAMSTDSHDDEIAAALASITAENILIPGGPQERYHQIVEEAYATLGLIETQVDELRAELEYQHKRLDEARDAALAQATQEPE